MSNLELLSAGFSAILGTDVVPQKSGGQYSINDLFGDTYSIMKPVELVAQQVEDEKRLMLEMPKVLAIKGVETSFQVFVIGSTDRQVTYQVTGEETVEQLMAKIEEREGIPGNKMRLLHSGLQLESHRTLNEYGIQRESTVHMVLRLTGGGPGGVCSFNTDELDPGFDYDFSNAKDDGERYMRGGFQYKRPYGWKRIAIKVVGKYDDDAWLGPNGIRTEEAPGEWPVSYHGTNMKSAKMILKEGYKAGPRHLFGRGIYTSPSLEMVERLYAKEFTYEGKTYKIALQNRVNPNQKNGHLQIIPASQTSVGADYWLSPGGIADVRPYGILIREVSN